MAAALFGKAAHGEHGNAYQIDDLELRQHVFEVAVTACQVIGHGEDAHEDKDERDEYPAGHGHGVGAQVAQEDRAHRPSSCESALSGVAACGFVDEPSSLGDISP